jgi:hypothetical protein
MLAPQSVAAGPEGELIVMRKLLQGVVLGLVLGVTIGLLLPAQGSPRHAPHHRQTLEQRVARLEAKTKNLNPRGELNAGSVIGRGCDNGDPAVWSAVPGHPAILDCHAF